LQFSVILYYKREIDAPTPDWAVNFPYVMQNAEKLQTSQGYIIRILQHFATKLWNITNFAMLFQAVMKFLSRIFVIRGKVHYITIEYTDLNEHQNMQRYIIIFSVQY
jgi:hypothetical protein